MSTLEQERAKHALACIRKVEELTPSGYGNYRSYVEALPAQIIMNGLGQAVATLLARRKQRADNADGKNADAYQLLHNHIKDWLCGKDPSAPYCNEKSLIDAIIQSDQDTYIRAHAECLAYLVWLKKFAQATLKRGEDRE